MSRTRAFYSRSVERLLCWAVVQGFDVGRFLQHRTPVWEELERTIFQLDQKGLKSFSMEEARRFGQLYRSVSSDLIRARTELVDAAVVDYLNDLVARSYAHIYTTRSNRIRKIWHFYSRDFPRLFRAEWKLIALSASLFLAGATFGSVFTAIDPNSLGVLIPDQHQAHTPQERVAEDETTGGLADGQQSAMFSSFLFTHNIRVCFMVFAFGITFGIGTAILLVYNGVPIGALAMQYHLAGKGVFFWAWILPHGIPELTAVFIAGASGLVIGRGLWIPGRRSRKAALLYEAKRAVQLVLGTMPILVLAGLIEGTISQMHAPIMPYPLKLAFALVVGVAVYAYLLFAGRRGTANEDPDAELA
jgi:uncharacterized membrane protein SpoIIM required for sporulation